MVARWWGIDAPVDDGEALLDEAVGAECDSGERPDFSWAQGFDRGDGADQHHRALSVVRILVLMGVGGFAGCGLRRRVMVQSSLMVRRGGFGRLRDWRYALRAPDRGNLGPREGEKCEEGDEAVHGV